jgi:xanthine dehydrogenase YagS FAD-binding subunit
MSPLTFVAAGGVAAALALAAGGTRFIAGGANLIDLMKVNVLQPNRLVDINRLGLDAIERTADGGLRRRMKPVGRHICPARSRRL